MSDSSTAVGGAPVRKLPGVQIVGTGSFVPDNVVTNEAPGVARLRRRLDHSAHRHSRAPALRRRTCRPATWRSPRPSGAMKAAGVEPRDIDLLIVATLSPDRLLPATATAVQHRLGLNCAAMDVSAACAGFMYALVTGMQYVATGCSRRALVIGADANRA